jgi:hypothetical protein
MKSRLAVILSLFVPLCSYGMFFKTKEEVTTIESSESLFKIRRPLSLEAHADIQRRCQKSGKTSCKILQDDSFLIESYVKENKLRVRLSLSHVVLVDSVVFDDFDNLTRLSQFMGDGFKFMDKAIRLMILHVILKEFEEEKAEEGEAFVLEGELFLALEISKDHLSKSLDPMTPSQNSLFKRLDEKITSISELRSLIGEKIKQLPKFSKLKELDEYWDSLTPLNESLQKIKDSDSMKVFEVILSLQAQIEGLKAHLNKIKSLMLTSNSPLNALFEEENDLSLYEKQLKTLIALQTYFKNELKAYEKDLNILNDELQTQRKELICERAPHSIKEPHLIKVLETAEHENMARIIGLGPQRRPKIKPNSRVSPPMDQEQEARKKSPERPRGIRVARPIDPGHGIGFGSLDDYDAFRL